MQGLMRNSIKSNPLSKKIPSIFVVASPLQVLCAYGTILNLQISRYKFYIIRINNFRDKQTQMVADYFNLKYDIIDKDKEVYPINRRFKAICYRRKGFKRAFVGAYCSTLHYFFALRNVTNGGVVAIIDDGNQSISVLNGNKELYTSKSCFSKLNEIFLNFSAFFRNIRLRKDFYTIYTGISSKNFSIGINDLSIVLKSKNSKNCRNVYIAGTAPNYIDQYTNLTYIDYLSYVNQLIKYVCNRHPNDKVIYIPHGRDDDKDIYRYCIENNVEYVRPKDCIELYFLDLIFIPKALYGLSSSCLFTAKKMMPQTSVYTFEININGYVPNSYSEFNNYLCKNLINKIILK